MTSILARDHHLQLCTEADALDLVSSGLPGCIFYPEDLHPDFFDLSNQIAGRLLQKLVNYRFQVAIILAEDHDYGIRVRELARDHESHPYIRFFDTRERAAEWLTA